MAWERRKHRWYYYEKQRIGGSVVSTYYGTGLLAEYTAVLSEIERTKHADERAAAARARQEQQRREREADTLAAHCHDLAHLALLAAGFHQHKGTWRKRRAQGVSMSKSRKDAPDLPALPAPDDTSPEARKAIITRCNRRDATFEDVQALRRILPQLDIADVGSTLRESLRYTVKVIANGNAWTSETTKAHLDQRRTDLGYADCTALERPLIDHLLLCELRLGVIENFTTHKLEEQVSVAQMQQIETLLDNAQRRYLRAVETLAKVRRLAVPVLVQQNITIGKGGA